MRVDKILFWLSFTGGWIITAIGALLYFTGGESEGFTYSKTGSVGSGGLTGFSTICLGGLVLLFSIFNLMKWKASEKERARNLQEENTIQRPQKKLSRREKARLSKHK